MQTRPMDTQGARGASPVKNERAPGRPLTLPQRGPQVVRAERRVVPAEWQEGSPALPPLPRPVQRTSPEGGVRHVHVWDLRARRRRFGLRTRRQRVLVGVGAALLVGMLLFAQAGGVAGAWTADALRAVLGARATAQVESWYLGLADAARQAEARVSGQKATAPWPTAAATPTHIVQRVHLPRAMALPAIVPLIPNPAPGEGVWTTAGLPAPGPSQPSLVARTFLHPDAARPYAVATLLQFDLRYATLHMVAGTDQPGGPRGMNGPGVIPGTALQGNTLLAAFNGGFKYADGHYGMMANNTIYVPPQQGTATVAVTRQGQVLIGAWGVDPALHRSNTDLVAWRQNAALLIDHGKINPLTRDGWAWGGTILNSTYTWRSGLGVTANGTLLYAAGNSLSAATLGKTLLAAGAVMAMQTDINPYWVRAFLYDRTAQGLNITKLHPKMQGSGWEYLKGTQRDFFYITRKG